MTLKKYYNINEIAEIANISIKTIERKRDKILSKNKNYSLVDMSKKPYKYHIDFLNEFLSPFIFEIIKNEYITKHKPF